MAGFPSKYERPTVLLVSLGASYGGAETYYLKLARILLERFHIVSVVCSPRLRDEFQALSIEVLYVGAHRKGASRYTESIWACRRMVALHKPRLAHCNGQPESYLAPFLRLMGLRVLTTRHTPFTSLFMSEGSSLPVFLKKSVVLFCLRCSQQTICVSQLLMHQLAAHVPLEKLVFVPAWVEDDLLIPYRRPQPSSPLRALFVGRVVRNKGIFDLLDAVRRCENVQLTVVGEGDDMVEAQRLAEGLPITFAGFSGDTASYYRAADLLIFASPEGFEGLPQVPLEALAMGVPCLASDILSIKEIAEVPAGQSPVLALYQQGNVEDLALQLSALAMEHARLDQLSHAGRRHVVQRFTVAAVAPQYMRAFTEALP
jgi:glycosyltransferase involved in cell wall biosynthesis